MWPKNAQVRSERRRVGDLPFMTEADECINKKRVERPMGKHGLRSVRSPLSDATTVESRLWLHPTDCSVSSSWMSRIEHSDRGQPSARRRGLAALVMDLFARSLSGAMESVY